MLLDATIDCLFEYGYAGMTTTEIADRAGVSRGAQLHHFSSKAELVATAVEHLFQRRHERFIRALAEVPGGVDRGVAAIDLLWDQLSGPTFYAWLELVVAARTDAVLKRQISGVALRFVWNVEESFRRIFPESKGQLFADVAPGFTFAVLQGLALENILEGSEPRVTKVLDAFKLLAQMIGTVGPAPLAAAPLPPPRRKPFARRNGEKGSKK